MKGGSMGPDNELDPKHPWLSAERYVPTPAEMAQGYTVYVLTDLWVNDDASGNCFGLAFNADGTPDDSAVFVEHWPDGTKEYPVHRNSAGQAEASFVMTNFDPKNGPGAYSSWFKGNSDKLKGAGLPLNHHAETWGVWTKRTVSPVAPPPPPTPPPAGNGCLALLLQWAASPRERGAPGAISPSPHGEVK
jgi:hypothetical protein